MAAERETLSKVLKSTNANLLMIENTHQIFEIDRLKTRSTRILIFLGVQNISRTSFHGSASFSRILRTGEETKALGFHALPEISQTKIA